VLHETDGRFFAVWWLRCHARDWKSKEDTKQQLARAELTTRPHALEESFLLTSSAQTFWFVWSWTSLLPALRG